MWADIYIPKTADTGVYQGTVTITQVRALFVSVSFSVALSHNVWIGLFSSLATALVVFLGVTTAAKVVVLAVIRASHFSWSFCKRLFLNGLPHLSTVVLWRSISRNARLLLVAFSLHVLVSHSSV